MVTNHRNQRRLGQTIVILLVVLGVTASSAQAAQENGGSELSRNNWISAPTNSNHDAFNQLLARAKLLFTTDGLGQPVNNKLQKELDGAEKSKSITQVRAIIQKELSKKKPAISSNRQLNASERRLDSPVHIDDVPLFTFDDETPWKTTTCINTNQTTLVVTNNKELNWKLTARLDAFTIDPQKVNNRTALFPDAKLHLRLTKFGNGSIPVQHAETNLYPDGQQVPLEERTSEQSYVFTAKCDASTLTMPKTNLSGTFKANLIFTVSATPQS